MDISIEEAFSEACRLLGESLVRDSILARTGAQRAQEAQDAPRE